MTDKDKVTLIRIYSEVGDYLWSLEAHKRRPNDIISPEESLQQLRDTFEWARKELESVKLEKTEGSRCDHCDDGVLEWITPDGCSCHISAPCGLCTMQPLNCCNCGEVYEKT